MPDWRILSFDRLDSTQHWLCERAGELPAGTAVLARAQHAGVGRQARSWHSPPGGLYASFLLKPPQVLPALPWALCWALLQALETACGCQLTIKAPNDLLADGRKLAGMLIDSRLQGLRPEYYVCGFGVNLAHVDFPPELAAVSLAGLGAAVPEPEALLQAVLASFEQPYALLLEGGFEAAILAALGGRRVQIGYNGQASISFEEYWHGGDA